MGKPRKKPAWSDDDPNLDALARLLRDIPGEKLRAVLNRDKTFTFRLSEMDRETMEKAAKAMEIPVAEYLIRLHWIAYDKMRDAGIVDGVDKGMKRKVN